MKKLQNFLLALLALFLIVGCGNSHQDESAKKIELTLQQLSATVDPVCKMSLEQHVISDTTTYEGKLYGFCSSGCKEDFLKDPTKYVADL